MTDPLGWLKLGPRTRTPSIPLPGSPIERRATRESQLGGPQRPDSSHLSSRATPCESGLGTSPTGDADDNAASLFVRNQDRVWYNPSLEQMIETLQVQLMTRGTFEPIPTEYNSYILHLIEGFARAQSQIRKADEDRRELTQSLERNLEQFRLLVGDWLERESQYQAEVKRLEVLLSQYSRDGLEAVTLARTNSVVDRRGAERGGFISRLREFKRDHLDGPAEPSISPAPLAPKILDNSNDFLVSEKFRRRDAVIEASEIPYRERRVNRHEAAQNYLATATSSSCSSSSSSSASFSSLQETVTQAPIIDSRGRSSFRGDEALAPGLHGNEGDENGFRTRSAASETRRCDTLSGTQSPSKNQMRAGLMADLLNLETSYHQECTSEIPTITKANAAVMTGAASRHRRDNSGFSFQPGDDFYQLSDNIAVRHGELEPSYHEPSYHEQAQSPSYMAQPTIESATTEKCRYGANVPNAQTNGQMLSKGKKTPRENSRTITRRSLGESLTVAQSPAGRPVHKRRGSSSSKQTAIKGSPISTGEQEIQWRNQSDPDARIAAALALSNALGSSNRNK